jgi:hypothetical protein
MKRLLRIVLVTLLSLMMVGAAFAATRGKMDLKVGEEVYVCNCGPSCPCQSMAMKEGNCACGKDKLVKAKVTKVEKDVAYVQAQGWEKPQAFPMQGKYVCACGPSCNCGSMSQTPGKCVCGNDMKPVDMKPVK